MFRAIQTRTLSCRELVAAHLARIQELEQPLNAMVTVCGDAALREAEQADRDLARGLVRGPLHGVPVTIKDLFETAGIPTAAGSPLRANSIPATDATVIKRIRDAGAIVLGKSNTPELGLSDETNSPLHGRTNNPYDWRRTPGGSGGGGAAIVAACGSPLDIGSDVGGSLRQPASFCGVAAIKPTRGRVPTTGHTPASLGLFTSLNHVGPIARTVDDLSLMLAAISGRDWRDPLADSNPYYDTKLRPVRRLRAAWYVDNGLTSPTKEVAAAVTDAVAAIAARKCVVTEATPPYAAVAPELHLQLFAADGCEQVRQLLRQWGGEHRAGPELREWLDYDNAVTIQDVRQAVRNLAALQAGMLAFMEDFDILLCPASATPAVRHGETRSSDTSNYQQLFNLTGWPAAVVRCGASDDGLPIGVQVVGRPWRETTVLEVAAALESEFGGWIPPNV